MRKTKGRMEGQRRTDNGRKDRTTDSQRDDEVDEGMNIWKGRVVRGWMDE